MTVRFELPAPWRREIGDHLVVWRRDDWTGRVEVDRLHELPTDRKEWGVRVLMRNLPPGGDVRQIDLVNSVNHVGWPLTMVSTNVLDATRTPVETRITMFYELLYFGTTIAAIVDREGVALWESTLRVPVIEAMLHLEPLFDEGGIANIADLWT